MAIDPEKLKAIRRDAIAKKPPAMSAEEGRRQGKKYLDDQIQRKMKEISATLEGAARSGHESIGVLIGHHSDPVYQGVLKALRRAGLDAREEYGFLYNLFSSRTNQIIVYLPR